MLFRSTRFAASMRFVTDNRDTKMHFTQVRAWRRSDRVKPRRNRGKLREEFIRGAERRFVEFAQHIEIIARVKVVTEKLIVVHELHQPIALLALRGAFGQRGHEFSVGPIKHHVLEEGLSKRFCSPRRKGDSRISAKLELSDDLIRQRNRVTGKDAQ